MNDWLSKVKARIELLTWMVGFNLALTVAIVSKLFLTYFPKGDQLVKTGARASPPFGAAKAAAVMAMRITPSTWGTRPVDRRQRSPVASSLSQS